MAQTTQTVSNWGEFSQKLFHNGKEVVKLGKNVTPHADATILEYTTKSTNELRKFVYAEQADILDKEVVRERQKQERELFKLYMAHEIGREDYIKALAQLDK